MKPRRWRNGWRVDVKHRGRRKSVTAPTIAEVKARAAQVLLELGGTPTDRVTVGELLEAHLAAVRGQITDCTHDAYARAARQIPRPFLDRQVADVTPVVVEALYRELSAAGRGVHAIRKVHTLLGVAWARAVRIGWANRNPAHESKPPPIRSAEVEPPDPDAIATVLQHCKPLFGIYVRVAASLGARRGEIVALQWRDIDLDTGQVKIRRSHSYSTSGIAELDTKTGRKGHRTVTLGRTVVTLLRRHHTAQLEQVLASGAERPVYVFSDDAGQTAWFVTSPTKMMRTAREAAGVTGVTIKDLRHWVATQMLAAGESPAQVAGRLGHSTPATTMKVYAHWIPAQDQDTAAMLDDLLPSTG